LVEYKAGATGSIDDIIPSLATSWNVSDDGLVWTFNLRQGVHYDDGTEFNATHVKYTFDRGIGIADGDGAFVGIGYDRIIDNVTVADKYVVKFYLKIPFSPFLSLLALPPSHMVDPAYAPPTSVVVYTEGDARASHPMGLGPYTLTNWTRTAGKEYEMRLQANPNYWDNASGLPKTKNIIIKFYADSTALALAMNNQEVDVAYRQLGTTDINSMKNNTNLKVWEGPGLIQYLVLQEKYAPFNNTIIRRAVGAAINRTSLVNTVFLGDAQELYSMIPNGMFGHTDAFLTLGNPNYTKTRELLAPLGYNETNKLTFTLWYETSGHYPQSPQQAQVLKSSLEASGVISLSLQGVDWPSYRTHRQSEDMDAYILGWYPDYIDPDDYIQPFLDSLGGSWLHDNYNNTQMDQLIAWARGNTTADARSSLYSQIQNLMVEDCPIIPTYQGKTYAVTKPSVEGVCLDTSELLRFWLLYGSKTWIVDDDGPADFHTIQEAINAANPGDTILVAPGVYHDQSVVVNKTITIIGEHGSGPVFDGGGSGQIFMSLLPGASGTVIQGLAITNYGQGIVVNASNCKIYNTIMSLMSQNGIALMGAGTVNNQIYGNVFQNNQIAVSLTASSAGNVVHDNIVSTNVNVGIDLESGGNIVCTNTISGNYLGIRVAASGNTIYHNNIISNVVQTGILEGAVNTKWDDGFPSGGNFWSDYVAKYPKAGQIGQSGIWNTPYTIDANNKDNYPLINPWGTSAGTSRLSGIGGGKPSYVC
jgi:peptide/nickel transport system substrate-binding protein